MSQLIELHATRDFGRKLNAIIEFVRQNFKWMSKSMLAIAGPFIILGSVLVTQFMDKMIGTVIASSRGILNDNTFGLGLGLSIVGACIFLLVGSIALISTVNQYVILYEEKQTSQITISEVWQKVKNNFWTVMGTMFLFVVAMIIIYVGMIVVAGIMTMIHPVLTLLAFLMIYIILLFAMNLFFMIIFVQAYEKKSFSFALNRSLNLIKGNWWGTLGIVIVAVILQSVISSIFILPLYANYIIAALHDSNGGFLKDPSLLFRIINYVSMGLYMIVSYMLYCLPLLAIVFQYFNLVEMKEAKGLMDKIENFGTVQTFNEDEEHY